MVNAAVDPGKSGKFVIQHWRDGKLVEEIETENTIVTNEAGVVVRQFLIPNGRSMTVLQDDTVNMKFYPPGLDAIQQVDFTRASGLMECSQCGKLYYDHPMGGPMAYNDQPYLHVLCDGSYVKL